MADVDEREEKIAVDSREFLAPDGRDSDRTRVGKELGIGNARA